MNTFLLLVLLFSVASISAAGTSDQQLAARVKECKSEISGDFPTLTSNYSTWDDIPSRLLEDRLNVFLLNESDTTVLSKGRMFPGSEDPKNWIEVSNKYAHEIQGKGKFLTQLTTTSSSGTIGTSSKVSFSYVFQPDLAISPLLGLMIAVTNEYYYTFAGLISYSVSASCNVPPNTHAAMYLYPFYIITEHGKHREYERKKTLLSTTYEAGPWNELPAKRRPSSRIPLIRCISDESLMQELNMPELDPFFDYGS